jgi:signal transduction histidine kinase
VRRPSLAHRLLASSLVGLAVLLLAGGAALSYAFRRSAETVFDANLDALQQALVASLHVDASGRLAFESALGDPRFEQVFSGWYWQIASERGEVLAASRSLWDQSLHAPGAGRAGTALELPGPRGQQLRALADEVTLPRGTAPYQVILAGDAADLRREIDRFDTLLIAGLVALGAGILALAALQARVALRPLHELEHEISAVREGLLREVGPDAPRELAPLVDSLNALLAHDTELVKDARAHAADLAHALKTPLSLVLAEAEELGDQRGRRIARHADTMRRHIEHRLTTAAPRPAVASERTPVAPVVEGIADTLMRLHPHVAIERDVAAGARFAGAREDLEEIVGNLLENACKWARRCVRVSASAAEPSRLRLVFDDDGPGLGLAEQRAVLERGVRLDEKAPGSGLGLAIVADLVTLYGGELSFDRSALGGLRVAVEFEPAKPGAR